MKKLFISSILVVFFNFVYAYDNIFLSLDSFIKTSSSQELELTVYDFTYNKIISYIHIKKIDDSVYVLEFKNGQMKLNTIEKDIFQNFCVNIKRKLLEATISEYVFPPVDDGTMLVSIVFRGKLECSIPMFNLIMLQNNDYRKSIYEMIIKLQNLN